MGPAARPAPCPQPRTPPPSRLGSGAQGHRSPGLGIFQAAEVQRTELGAPPHPAPQGPSARPSRPEWGPGPGGTASSGWDWGQGGKGPRYCGL